LTEPKKALLIDILLELYIKKHDDLKTIILWFILKHDN